MHVTSFAVKVPLGNLGTAQYPRSARLLLGRSQRAGTLAATALPEQRAITLQHRQQICLFEFLCNSIILSAPIHHSKNKWKYNL